MRRRNRVTFIIILIITGVALAALLKTNFDLPVIGERNGMRLGLDLKGGTHLVYEADLSKRPEGQAPQEAMDGALGIIENRVNAYGVSEPIIQQQGENRISVQLPGIRNVAQAMDLIGSTARLEFKERSFDAQGNPVDTPTELTGSNLKGARPGVNQDQTSRTYGQPIVYFEFKSDAAQKFADLTTKVYQTYLETQSGSRARPDEIAVFLDQVLITSPTVKEGPITGGNGFIEGNFTLDEARSTAIKLNAGALPVPLKGPIVREDVDPTLGRDSIDKSLLAGLIGLAMVVVFMLFFYRFPGAIASAALVVYAILGLAIFKLVPVTLTLAGVAGFILSIGMAVDANVLIFERMKEELRAGRTIGAAIEVGFSRAWTAIRDSNVSTLITCAILYWLGDRVGEARLMGFALTLGIGVVLSMFTAITVSRSFLRLFLGSRVSSRLSLFGITQEPKALSKEQE